MSSDQEIIRDLRQGRNKEFGLLFERYWKLCFFYFTRIRFIDTESAQELVQEVFLRVYSGISKFELGRPFKVWLMAITRNMANDFARGAGRRISSENIDTQEGVSGGQTMEDDVVRRLILEEGLQGLPDRQREVFEMKYYWGMKANEIGSTLGMPEGTVRSDLHFARRKIMELIEESAV